MAKRLRCYLGFHRWQRLKSEGDSGWYEECREVAVADKGLDAARRELSGLLDKIERAQARFEDAWVERVIAVDGALRERVNGWAKVRRPELPDLGVWRMVVASSPSDDLRHTRNVERDPEPVEA